MDFFEHVAQTLFTRKLVTPNLFSYLIQEAPGKTSAINRAANACQTLGSLHDDTPRERLIQRVRTHWIDRFLRRTTSSQIYIETQFSIQEDNVTSPWIDEIQQPSKGPDGVRTQLSSREVQGVLKSAGGSLLILGEPGSGKTTMLLRMAEDCLEAASLDAGLPVPVVFLLATWSRCQGSLLAWLEDEIQVRYQVRAELAKCWISNGQIFPLLDGLDEMELSARLKLVQEINVFAQHLTAPLVVTCRSRAYAELGEKRLMLGTAIQLEPISIASARDFLDQHGAPGEALVQAIAANQTLRSLCSSPFFLFIALALIRDNSLPEDTITEQSLVSEFVNQAFRRGRPIPCSIKSETIRTLELLADNMTSECRYEFRYEDLQPTWLQGRLLRATYVIASIMSLSAILLIPLTCATLILSAPPNGSHPHKIAIIIGGFLIALGPQSLLVALLLLISRQVFYIKPAKYLLWKQTKSLHRVGAVGHWAVTVFLLELPGLFIIAFNYPRPDSHFGTALMVLVIVTPLIVAAFLSRRASLTWSEPLKHRWGMCTLTVAAIIAAIRPDGAMKVAALFAIALALGLTFRNSHQWYISRSKIALHARNSAVIVVGVTTAFLGFSVASGEAKAVGISGALAYSAMLYASD